jgi:hypothetical protein
MACESHLLFPSCLDAKAASEAAWLAPRFAVFGAVPCGRRNRVTFYRLSRALLSPWLRVRLSSRRAWPRPWPPLPASLQSPWRELPWPSALLPWLQVLPPPSQPVLPPTWRLALPPPWRLALPLPWRVPSPLQALPWPWPQARLSSLRALPPLPRLSLPVLPWPSARRPSAWLRVRLSSLLSRPSPPLLLRVLSLPETWMPALWMTASPCDAPSVVPTSVDDPAGNAYLTRGLLASEAIG